MSLAAAQRPRARLGPFAIGLMGCGLLALWTLLAPTAALQGWLIAFVVVSGAPLGAVALLAIGVLTGGGWRDAANPILTRAAAATPLICLAFAPLPLGAQWIFPWGHGGAAPRDVLAILLNGASFGLRDGLGLIGLAVAALALIGRRSGRLAAALSLVLFAVVADYSAFDWILSFATPYTSSAFGAEWAIQQILSALALVLLFGSDEPSQPAGDLGGLTFATALGLLYFEAMTLIIKWYGDQSDDATWYLTRIAGVWLWLALVAIALAAILPLAALLFADVRHSSRALRAVGVSILVGVTLRDFWLIAPSATPAAIPAAALGLVTLVALCVSFSSRVTQRGARHGT